MDEVDGWAERGRDIESERERGMSIAEQWMMLMVGQREAGI